MAEKTAKKREQREELPLSKAAQYLFAECRMVLPGIQALFGFQLIVVFNPGFSQKLGEPGQLIHLLAITLVAIAVALIMTPAALHRRAGAREVTETLVSVSARLLMLSMLPLALGICLDFYLIADVIIGGRWMPLLAVGLFSVFVGLWLVLPRIQVVAKANSSRQSSAAA